MKPNQLSLLRSLAFGSSSRVCTNCVRQFSSLRPLLQEAAPSPEPKPSQQPPQSPLQSAKTLDPTTPSGHWSHPGYIAPLGRPIGSSQPPSPHDNHPVDTRSLKEKHADFTNYDKHILKRRKIQAAMARPYFRDWKNLKFEKGKLWLGNEKLWKKDVSLWMPNLVGATLEGDAWKATTKVLEGKISIVSIFQREWARDQCETWISPKHNPQLASLVKEGLVHVVNVNVEDAPLMKGVQKLFTWYMRKGKSEREQGRYFFVKQIPDSVKEEIGVLNMRVGYVYLVDEECRIRWAGCGEAKDGEKEALLKGAEKLVRLGGASPNPAAA